VQRTGDGHVVVIHDGTLDRTTDGHGKVYELSLSQIRSSSAGYAERFGSKYADQKVPTLAEALGLLRGRSRVMIEIKKESVETAERDDSVEALLVETVRAARMIEDVAVISFERRALLRCKALAPEIRRGHLFYKASVEDVLSGAREIESDLVMPEKGMLSDSLRDSAQEAGLKVATWVVDDPGELRELARFDLYGVGSNAPGLLLDALWGRD
jgi:glycerophosphoryl diester phosphodiesterase